MTADKNMTDKRYIRLALKLAKKERPSPNPRVGCVIVKDKRIIGKGYHVKPGHPHAEIIALRNAGSKAAGATMYVTLEPCCIHGRTLPCTKAIIKAKIRRVVVACHDKNPKVCYKGINQLRKSGIYVRTGVLGKEAEKLNEAFFKHIRTKLPFVTIKTAISADGKISYADKRKKWISSIEQRRKAHQLRAENDAILVGINTILADNPKLTTRHVKGKNPLRIILDSKLRLPVNSNVLADKNVLIITSNRCNKSKRKRLIEEGFEVITIKKNKKTNQLDWNEILRLLGKRNITSLMIEGGAAVIDTALRQHVADKAILFFSTANIGNGIEFMEGINTKQWIIKKLQQAL